MAVKLLRCVYCAREFSFTETEQQYFSEKGYEEPKRCPTCRGRKKENSRDEHDNNGNRREAGNQKNRYYHVSCFACGTQTTIYYRPSPERPALCSGCNQGSYRKRRRF